MRLLSKSRFRLGLECPTKLYYTGKPEYPDHSIEDQFLEALARGGFQVEELARHYYPGGHMIRERDSVLAAAETRAFLEEPGDIALYEAAFQPHRLIARTDILLKEAGELHILEVKAKSYAGDQPMIGQILGKRGGIDSDWRIYLWDLAFQVHCSRLAFPEMPVRASLLLADKSARASRDGLNQLFKIDPGLSDNWRDAIRVPPDLRLEDLGEPVLIPVEVTDIIEDILGGRRTWRDRTFLDLLEQFAEAYATDQEIISPVGRHCKKCTFVASEDEKAEGKRCGHTRCWSRATGLGAEALEGPKVYDVWNLHFTKVDRLLEGGTYLARDIREPDIDIKPMAGRLSHSERQWIQVEKLQTGDTNPYVLREELAETLASHRFPLHFIDFETHTSPLPYHRGRRPYEQIAFQYSHHVLHEDGRIQHRDQYIAAGPGAWPNYEFLRSLMRKLSTDDGTIFRYATHENMVLRQIRDQLAEEDGLADRAELIEFIDHITEYKPDKKTTIAGDRNMVDLCELIQHYYYHPYTKGSNSLKYVLPAMIRSLDRLQEKYSRPIGESDIDSINQAPAWRWIRPERPEGLDPYRQLPSLFGNFPEVHSLLQDLEHIQEGGAAMAAYGKLQYTEISDAERQAIVDGLLRYCELDTLAMVMVYEGLISVSSTSP